MKARKLKYLKFAMKLERKLNLEIATQLGIECKDLTENKVELAFRIEIKAEIRLVSN